MPGRHAQVKIKNLALKGRRVKLCCKIERCGIDVNSLLYWFTKLLCRLLFAIGGGLTVYGAENIPRNGPMIVVANHASLLDGFILTACLPYKITYFSSAYLFDLPLVGQFLCIVGAIPVEKNEGGIKAIKKALRVLEAGGVLGIFPEGGIGPESKVRDFQPGWSYLAIKSGVPVLPIAIRGSSTVLPLGARIPRRGKITVIIGKPQSCPRELRPRRETMAAANTCCFKELEYLLSNKSSGNGGCLPNA